MYDCLLKNLKVQKLISAKRVFGGYERNEMVVLNLKRKEMGGKLMYMFAYFRMVVHLFNFKKV